MPLPLTEVLQYRPSRSVYERFLHEYPLSQTEAELIFADCLRFLWLTAKKNEERQHDPSTPDITITKGLRIVDEMWHCFILYTEYYTQFCEKYLGGFVHHPPVLHKYYATQEQAGTAKANELMTNEFIDCVYNELGKDVAVRWFDTYVDRYDYAKMMH